MPLNETQQPRFLIKRVDRRKHRTEKIADIEVLTCLRRVSPVNSFGRKCANCALLSAVGRKILQRGNFMVVLAVYCEPVSIQNSLLTGNLA